MMMLVFGGEANPHSQVSVPIRASLRLRSHGPTSVFVRNQRGVEKTKDFKNEGGIGPFSILLE